MDMAEPPFDASTFSKNRKRLLAHDVANQFFAEAHAHSPDEHPVVAEAAPLLSRKVTYV